MLLRPYPFGRKTSTAGLSSFNIEHKKRTPAGPGFGIGICQREGYCAREKRRLMP